MLSISHSPATAGTMAPSSEIVVLETPERGVFRSRFSSAICKFDAVTHTLALSTRIEKGRRTVTHTIGDLTTIQDRNVRATHRALSTDRSANEPMVCETIGGYKSGMVPSRTAR